MESNTFFHEHKKDIGKKFRYNRECKINRVSWGRTTQLHGFYRIYDKIKEKKGMMEMARKKETLKQQR